MLINVTTSEFYPFNKEIFKMLPGTLKPRRKKVGGPHMVLFPRNLSISGQAILATFSGMRSINIFKFYLGIVTSF